MNSTDSISLPMQKIVTQEEWLTARKAHLKREKELSRLYDQIAVERRELPWVRIDKKYVFEGRDGKKTFSDLFEGRNQLMVQHFMFGPEWEEGCVGCSYGADHVDCARQHFEHNDLSFVAVSRAPISKIEDFRKRMGWGFNWVSSFGSDFNYDFNVSFSSEQIAKGETYYNYERITSQEDELPGISIFYKDEGGEIYHTYSTYGRGGEFTLGTYMFLDMTPKGCNEQGPNYNLTDWVRHHDKYQPNGLTSNDSECCCNA